MATPPALPAKAPGVLLWGTYDAGKPRLRILREGMAAADIQVSILHAGVWERFRDKSRMGPRAALRVGMRLLLAYPLLLIRLLRAERPDLVLVSYPGLMDVLLAKLVARWWRVPVFFDVFISLYDTIVLDRKMLRAGSIAARCLFAVEQWSLRAADRAFMDTASHARRIEQLFGLPPHSVGHVWVGAETAMFRPATDALHQLAHRRMQVLFYGQFIPLHGLPTIIEAARLLEEAEIDWVIVGEGQETARVDAMLAAHPLPRLHRIAWLEPADLARQVADADLCLGIFGTSDKAASVIPNKIFQIIAAGRPFITRDSPAIRELINPSRWDAELIPSGQPQALADAIQRFHRMGHWKTRRDHHRELRQAITPAAIGQQFLALLDPPTAPCGGGGP